MYMRDTPAPVALAQNEAAPMQRTGQLQMKRHQHDISELAHDQFLRIDPDWGRHLLQGLADRLELLHDCCAAIEPGRIRSQRREHLRVFLEVWSDSIEIARFDGPKKAIKRFAHV